MQPTEDLSPTGQPRFSKMAAEITRDEIASEVEVSSTAATIADDETVRTVDSDSFSQDPSPQEPKKKNKKKKQSQQQNQSQATPTLPENGYVTLISKRLRNIKKKLDKIKDIESKMQQGKAVNEQQLEALSKKDDLLKIQSELESVRTQLTELQLEVSSLPCQAFPSERLSKARLFSFYLSFRNTRLLSLQSLSSQRKRTWQQRQTQSSQKKRQNLKWHLLQKWIRRRLRCEPLSGFSVFYTLSAFRRSWEETSRVRSISSEEFS